MYNTITLHLLLIAEGDWNSVAKFHAVYPLWSFYLKYVNVLRVSCHRRATTDGGTSSSSVYLQREVRGKAPRKTVFLSQAKSQVRARFYGDNTTMYWTMTCFFEHLLKGPTSQWGVVITGGICDTLDL